MSKKVKQCRNIFIDKIKNMLYKFIILIKKSKHYFNAKFKQLLYKQKKSKTNQSKLIKKIINFFKSIANKMAK